MCSQKISNSLIVPGVRSNIYEVVKIKTREFNLVYIYSTYEWYECNVFEWDINHCRTIQPTNQQLVIAYNSIKVLLENSNSIFVDHDLRNWI